MKINADLAFPVISSFLISILLSPLVIPMLRKMKIGQTIRAEGVKKHMQKNGTPTMGGLIILGAIVLPSVFYMRRYPNIVPVIFVALGFGIIGFLDDYIKVVMKSSCGLSPLQKITAQAGITTVFVFFLMNQEQFDFCMLKLPFTGGETVVLPLWAGVLLAYVAVLGTVNGVNFTDGLDGLAASITLLVAVFFTVVSIGAKSGIEPVTCAAAGSLMGFLLFNVYPAQVFMGDTGSLALGGFVVATAYMLQMPLYLVVVGMIYVVEVASVMIQVIYYKLTHGKRFFKMAPIHHHFELCGYSETQIVTLFSIITAFLCVTALLGI